MSEIPYCADSCGRPATTERLSGMIGETLVVELVCERCKALSDFYSQVGFEFEKIKRAFRAVADALTPAVEAIVGMIPILVAWHEEALRCYVIERLGITEVDIKSIDGWTVRTWNRRKLSIDRADFEIWRETA